MKKYIISLLIIVGTVTVSANTTELYKKCAGCHGENGELSALEASAFIGGQEKNLTIKELTAYKNGELNQYGLGNIMNMQIETLSEEEIEELASYIAMLQPKVD